MKKSMENSSSLDLLKGASTIGSSQSRSEQELPRSNSIPNGRDDLSRHNDQFLWCLHHGIDLMVARAVLAELVGTFILMYCVYGIVGGTQLMGVKGSGLLEYALTAGSAIITIVYCIGTVSGAHVNPAVTIAFATFGHFPWHKVLFYVGAQVLGSVLGTYVGRLVYGVKPELLTTQPNQSSTVAAFAAEFLATFIIMFLVVSLARDVNSVGQLSGIVMGIGIALGVLISAPISGGSMNPARSLGPAIVSGKFDHIWIYLVAPPAGAILGVLMVHALCIHPMPFRGST
ncbi:hypothetical protein Dimus_004209 [Dionaea muscipula]